jgi:hypothetical protein
MKIEIVKLIDHYHSAIIDGRVFIRDSSLTLENSLSICFKQLKNIENVSIETTSFDDSLDYELYIDSKC